MSKNLSQGFGVSDIGLNRLNVQQIYSLSGMFHTHPAVQAARTVLHSQLFAGGIQLVRDGEVRKVVKESKVSRVDQQEAPGSTAGSTTGSLLGEPNGIRQAFAQHLEKHWVAFARDICDSFLCWGVCAVALELEDEDASEKAARLAKEEEGIGGAKGKKRATPVVPKRLVPIVPQLGTYEIGYEGVGRFGYKRRYVVYAQAPGQPLKVDEQTVVHVRTVPDSVGNINSPMATVWNMGSFVHAITELAMSAEITRAQPQIVTQLRKQEKSAGLDPGALFFDAESRNVQATQDQEENEGAARSLEMQAQLCKIINFYQTTSSDGGPTGMGSSSKSTFQPPDIQPKLFTLPKEHEIAATRLPEARGDLTELMRINVDQIGAALGVPSSLLFEGKFSGKSTQQLSLLNSTVSQLAKSINDVLTQTYNSLYPDDDVGGSNVELKLRTSPLAATEDLVALYSAGMIDINIAVPSALHALGASAEEIDAALERAKAKEEKQCECEDEEREWNKKDRDMTVKEREVGLNKTVADLKKVCCQRPCEFPIRNPNLANCYLAHRPSTMQSSHSTRARVAAAPRPL